jgi:hypothetical protein
MRLLLPLLLLPFHSSLPIRAQRLPTPFRNPDVQLAMHPELFAAFATMRRLVEQPGSAEVKLDAEGREYSTDPQWEQARARTLPSLPRLASDVGYVLHQSANPDDRATAAYALFFVEDLAQTVQYVALFASEPVYEIRQKGLARAVPFLRVQLAKQSGDGAPQFAFDPAPFVAMLRSYDSRDDALALWFLARLAEIRPALRAPILAGAESELREILQSADPARLEWANGLLAALDPEPGRAVLRAGAPAAERTGWLDSVLYSLFPPLRRISAGLYELHPSADRDELVRVGRVALQQDSIGVTVSGRLANGMPYRGYRIARQPPPLDRIGLPLDAIVAAIDGQPVATAAELLAKLEPVAAAAAKPGSPDGAAPRSLLVEFVAGGKRQAIEYRIIR